MFGVVQAQEMTNLKFRILCKKGNPRFKEVKIVVIMKTLAREFIPESNISWEKAVRLASTSC